jgi:hypothetical protein
VSLGTFTQVMKGIVEDKEVRVVPKLSSGGVRMARRILAARVSA